MLVRARSLTAAQRRIAAVAVVAVLVIAPALPVSVMVVIAAVAVWASAQPVLVGIVLGAVGLHRYRVRRAGA
jgi:hypothetical protein